MNKSNRDQSPTKKAHKIQILNYLRICGSAPRSDIAEHLGLAKAAVTLFVNEMLESGILIEQGEILIPKQKQKRGRRKIIIDINENCRLVFGLVIERDFLFIGLTNLKGDVLDRIKISLENYGYRDILSLIVNSIQQLTKNNCIISNKLLGMGICISKSGGMHIDGSSMTEKLIKLKKDLSYAITISITTAPTIIGALIAQHLFADTKTKYLFMIRFGEVSECSILANGQVYYGFNGQAGGFEKMTQNRFGGFDAFREESGIKNGFNTQLNERLAEIIFLSATILNPEKVIGFGSYLESENAIPQINLILQKRYEHPLCIERCAITEETIFHAGCAIAIADFFYHLNI